MAAYGVGVQNRYSAFLDDEDCLMLSTPAIVSWNAAKREQTTTTLANGKQVAGKGVANANAVTGASQGSSPKVQSGTTKTNRQTNASQQKSTGPTDHQKRAPNAELKRQRPNQQNAIGASSQSPNKAYSKQQGNTNQDNTANNSYNNNIYNTNTNYGGRFTRNQPSSNHRNQFSSPASQIQQGNLLNKENSEGSQQQQGKFVKSHNFQQQRPNNGSRRQYLNNNDELQLGNATGGVDDLGANAAFVNMMIGPQSNEEKLRRQQKRALDLKHKDPEKRENRRQQQQQQEQSLKEGETSGTSDVAELSLRGSKNRRQQVGDGTNNRSTDNESHSFRAGPGFVPGRGRGRRNDGGDSRDAPNGERSTRNGDRPPQNRIRNGYSSGSSRGGRVFKGDGEQGRFSARESDRPKPIPNISDKLDFPSLAP